MPIRTGWTKDAALSEVKHLADETRELAAGGRFSEAHSRWWARTLAVLEEVFGGKSRYFLAIAGLKFHETRDFVVYGIYDMDEQVNSRHQKAFERDLDTCRGLLLAAADHLERSDLAAVFDGKDTPPESSQIVRVINLAERNLRKIIRNVPAKEKEVQDAFENLLVGAELSYSREADHIEYSSKTYIPDFTMPEIDLAVEIKLCGHERRETEAIAEINDDILAYATKYGNQLFVVYDVGMIRDVGRFSGSFESHPNVVVRVVKH